MNILDYKNTPSAAQTNKNEYFRNLNDDSDIILQQTLIFDKLFTSSNDSDDLFTLLSCLSNTISGRVKALKEEFLSEKFHDLLFNNLSFDLPLISETVLIVITKLLTIYGDKNFDRFCESDFLLKYFDFIFHENLSLKICSFRIFALVSSISEENAIKCLDFFVGIYEQMNLPRNEEVLMYGLCFILQIMKINDLNVFYYFEDFSFVFESLNSSNMKIRLISMEIYREAVLKKLDYFLENIDQVLLFDDTSSEIVAASLRICKTFTSLSPMSAQSMILIYKLFHLLSHRSTPNIRFLTLESIESCLSHFPTVFEYNDSYTQVILKTVKNGGLNIQVQGALCLAYVILKIDISNIVKVPIQEIMNLFLHVLESDSEVKKIRVIFSALLLMIDATTTFDNCLEVLKPVYEFDFSQLSEKMPENVKHVKDKLDKISRNQKIPL
ncbi:hypothetical protein TRFO_33523 [Tritrichomonas foetus]|uniref:Uncharacterized protein n=1 Tax=Tritrichomonas foetus TaxID=1144522 RepID=A0A1J4JR21_9EUKA|nr:hypothetical protein TRFO_33523 [Tritrichomonas foetus]|eukprot:OHS99955.1 hypothetical protein TRFO_33523 [Tritrichomonas foetus]